MARVLWGQFADNDGHRQHQQHTHCTHSHLHWPLHSVIHAERVDSSTRRRRLLYSILLFILFSHLPNLSPYAAANLQLAFLITHKTLNVDLWFTQVTIVITSAAIITTHSYPLSLYLSEKLLHFLATGYQSPKSRLQSVWLSHQSRWHFRPAAGATLTGNVNSPCATPLQLQQWLKCNTISLFHLFQHLTWWSAPGDSSGKVVVLAYAFWFCFLSSFSSSIPFYKCHAFSSLFLYCVCANVWANLNLNFARFAAIC